MNRKNRKEKEQNTDVSKQICVHKTQNTLLEFNSFLRMAEPKDFWHLHEDIASDYSRIRAVMVDYSKEDSISVYANLSPEIIKYLYAAAFPIGMVQIVIVCYPVLMQIKKLYLSNTIVKLYFVQSSV
jgi:hypothetical protein